MAKITVELSDNQLDMLMNKITDMYLYIAVEDEEIDDWKQILNAFKNREGK